MTTSTRIPDITAETIRGTYDQLLPIFKNLDRRKLQNNTYARLEGDRIIIRYHYTDILTYHGDDTVTINTSGWHTMTTAQRFHAWLPSRWFVSNDRPYGTNKWHNRWNLFTPGTETITSGAGTPWKHTYVKPAAQFVVWDGMTVTDAPRLRVVNFQDNPEYRRAA